jgi:hypothetical protein
MPAKEKIRGRRRSNQHGNNNPSNNQLKAQLKDRARSPGSQILSSTMANPNGQATQNSVLQTLPQLAHQAPQIRELNNEFLLAYNSLIPNSEFARAGASANDTGAAATTTGTGRGG